MKKAVLFLLKKFGYELLKSRDTGYPDFEAQFMEIYKVCKPYSMTSPERMYAVYKSVEYIIKNNIEGDFVECGVWKGGSSMVAAMTLYKLGISNRKLYLYDTFEGMTEPTEKDKDFTGYSARKHLEESQKEQQDSVWCFSPLEEVKENMAKTGYPSANIHLIKGKVEDTIPKTLPSSISLLRLDTDWYESTYHEMTYLFPLLTSKGILIIDDYGHWEGARKAIDQYMNENNIGMLLNRIDYTGRIGVKY